MSNDQPWHLPVNVPTPVLGGILLVPYDNTWPDQFEIERARISKALGSTALAIEHIGSTAVPGLSAKPIIDIMVVVEDAAVHERFIPFLESAGYVLRVVEPDPTPGTKYTGTEPHCAFKGFERDLNLHVWSASSPDVERQRRFRDHLRSSPEDRNLYQAEKIRLANAGFATIQDYAEAKTSIIEEILERASRR